MKYEDGEIRINFEDLFTSLSDEDKALVCHHPAFDDQLMESIVGRLLGESVFDEGWWVGPDRTAAKLREKLCQSEFVDDVTAKCVAALVRERDDAERDKERHIKYAYSLYHGRYDEPGVNIALPDWFHISEPSKVEAEAILDTARKKYRERIAAQNRDVAR